MNTLPLNSDLLQRFLEKITSEGGVAANTLCAYSRDTQQWCDFLKDVCPLHVDASFFQEYIHFLYESGKSFRTISRKLSVLRQFYRFLFSEGFLQEDVMASVSLPGYTKKLPQYFSEEEIRQLFHEAQKDTSPEGKRLLAILEILYTTGMRISELMTFPLATMEAALKDPKSLLVIVGKGGHERITFLTPSVVETVSRYLEVRAFFLPEKHGKAKRYLFPSWGSGGFLTRQRVGQYLKALALSAQINPERLSPHVLRHAFATHVLQEGMDLVSLQNLLGHKDISTTQMYTRVCPSHLTQVLEKCHPLSKKVAIS